MRRKLSKILVTGGAGFIGSAFVRLALRRGYKIVIVDKLTYAGDLKRLQELKRRYKFYRADICNKKQIRSILNREKPDTIVNFAAQTHVDRSILDSSPFIATNLKGTQILVDISKKYKIKKFVHISCYDKETRALTTEGLKTYEKLKEGDRVFSLNPVTCEIEIKPIEKIIVQHYKGKMIYFRNRRINLLVTPNHRMFILNTSKKKKKLIVETAEKVMRRSIFYMPEGSWVGKDEVYFSVKDFGTVKTKDLMYILGIFIGDGFIAYQEKGIETKTGLTKNEFLTKARDMGNGRFKKIEKDGNHISVSHSYRIFFDIPENDKCRRKVEIALSNLGIRYHCHKGKAGTHLYFTSKQFMEFFAQCGDGAHNKHIPRWALEYSVKYLNYLLEGLLDSDGSRGVIYHTVSKKLVSDFCELCIKLNFKPNILKRHTKSFVGNRKLEGDSYCISIGKTPKSISRNRIRSIDYNGAIWCLRIKDNKNFIVERNGRLDFCGNTDEVYGEIKKGSFSERSPLRPNSPYAASKAAADLLINAYVRTYRFPAIIIRPSNNYGPWQYPEKFIPLAILKILRNEKIPVYAKGKNVREWLFVDDCAQGILKILEKGKVGEVYNIGSNQEKQNIEVAKTLVKILDADKRLISFVKDRPGHDIRYRLNCRKIREEIGFRPRTGFDEGLRRTIYWCVNHKDWLFSKWSNIARIYKNR
ncbi:MAG: GDP-mannose 4,6-dehydratase [Candidatus Omnitrophica bacterium]|nr:GDP-mannose 4,6-dehydratase [Candidatus Omnitrophota bacterium]